MLLTLTDRAVVLVAELGLFGLPNAVFAPILSGWVIAKTLALLNPSSAGDGAGIPHRPGTPFTID